MKKQISFVLMCALLFAALLVSAAAAGGDGNIAGGGDGTGTPIKDPAPQQIKLKSSTYAPYFAQHTPAKEIERVIGEALAFYFAQHKSEKGGVA